MTNQDLEAIYKANLGAGRFTALRAVWNAGWYEGAAVTPAAASPDKSCAVSKPTAIIQQKHSD